MTELEKIEYAKSFIDKLAEGINPIDNTPIPDGDIANNLRLSRCFFYVSDILRRVIENGGVESAKSSKKVRKEKSNDLDKLMNFVGSLPRPVLEVFFGSLRVLEYHGIMPKSLTAGDPNYSSVLLSNLGSIKSDSCYHHLSNYGTCSVMITIGVLHKEQKQMPDGSWQERDVINCTFNIDERLADGFYFAKSLRIADYMLTHPESMTEPISKTVPVEL
jgi:hypothetical protein